MIAGVKIFKIVGAVIGVLAVAWGLYAGLIRPTTKPNPTTTQAADHIHNYTYQPRPLSFGCVRWDIKSDKP
jgi:hypothetical protein